ncbi:MAG: hypothetical protein IKS09_01385 [Lachnospiraceae bacterium]|nr:hypothetical protein [Lachnospiraceae bacterium]
MKGSKCYGLIVNKTVRIVFTAVLLLLLCAGVFIAWYFTEYAAFSFLIYIHVFGVMAIVMADHFSFGGICTKDMADIGFLKSAVNGLDVLKKAIVTDFYIRACSIFVLVVAPIVIGNAIMGYDMTVKKILFMFIMLFAAFFSQNLSVVVGRHMTTMYIKMMTSSLFTMISIFVEVIALLDATDENGLSMVSIILGGVCLVGGIITSVISFTDVNRSLNRSFYDQNRG